MDQKQIDEYLTRTRAIIEEHGWAIQAVVGSAQEGGGYSYTIGLTETLGHPEIFMVGFDPQLCQRLLNDVGNLIRNGADFRQPCLDARVIMDFNVAFRPVDPESVARYGNVGTALLGDYEAVQLFLPDASGRFPWDEGCDPAYAKVQTGTVKTIGPIPDGPQPGLRLN